MLLTSDRFESFNSRVREYNVLGNRLAPSRDIAHRFSIVQHIPYICHGGNLSSGERYMYFVHVSPAYQTYFSHTFIMHRCGDALMKIFQSPVMQYIMCGIPMDDLHGTRLFINQEHPGR